MIATNQATEKIDDRRRNFVFSGQRQVSVRVTVMSSCHQGCDGGFETDDEPDVIYPNHDGARFDYAHLS